MILAVDIGNSTIHLGLFIRGALRKTWRMSTRPHRTSDEYSLLLRGLIGEGIPLMGCIISSVVPSLEWPFSQAVEQEYKTMPLILDHQIGMGIINGYENPKEVGMDRLANAVGAEYLFGAPLLVIDFGTAITIDFMDKSKSADGTPVYYGGAILPGIEMSADALVQGTARLPRVPLIGLDHVLGRTTSESIQAGLMHGMVGAITTIVDRSWQEIGEVCRVIATGGDVIGLDKHLPFIHAVEPNLTLFGLRQIYGINNNCPLPVVK
jgi:type III pantothenate kinase